MPDNKLNLKDPFDDQILAIAIEQKKYIQEYESIALVTLDTNLRVKADAYGLGAQSYTNPEIKDLSTSNILHINNIDFDITDIKNGIDCPIKLLKNQGVILHKQDGNSILAREKNGKLKLVQSKEIYGIRTRNLEQALAIEMLLDPDIKLVTLQGVAGAGKTLLSVIAGLHQTISGQYKKLLVSKPVIPVGKQDLGFLPGTLEEKMAPWMKPIIDNLEVILMSKSVSGMKTPEDLKRSGIFDIEALAYIRGRSIVKQFIICDEMQNISPSEARTLLTRMGEGTKAVFLGDCSQIDSPYLNKYNNGLIHVVNKLNNEDCVANITFEKGERSHLANLAAEKL